MFKKPYSIIARCKKDKRLAGICLNEIPHHLDGYISTGGSKIEYSQGKIFQDLK